MSFGRRYTWTLISFGTTGVHTLVLFAAGEALYRRGISLEDSGLAGPMGLFHLGAIVVAVIAGFVALVKESPWFGIVSVLAGLFSFLLYNP
jgi:hypothetical protein